VEWITETFYTRTVRLGNHQGWIKVSLINKKTASRKNTLTLEFTHSLTPVLPILLQRVRNLFDLNARPDIISQQLSRDKLLSPLLKANPGMRLPGAFNGFEIGLRAILGQQITVKAATTIAGRLAASFGELIITPYSELNRLTPTSLILANASIDDLAKNGIIRARCISIIALAQAEISGELSLDNDSCHKLEENIERLTKLPGIGQWTAHYIAMRALRWPDAFPKGDIAILNKLGGISSRQAEEMSQLWRPWRSYAVLYLWRSLKKQDKVEHSVQE
jgi:AraC family transcriptional regulator of adaptative response / DNA-3-methyladenine glycosylase II